MLRKIKVDSESWKTSEVPAMHRPLTFALVPTTESAHNVSWTRRELQNGTGTCLSCVGVSQIISHVIRAEVLVDCVM
jgi:hypothetical protein